MSFKILSAALICAKLATTTPFASLSPRAEQLNPVIAHNFPDPAVIGIGGGAWLAFATEGNNKKGQIAKSTKGLDGPWTILDQDLLADPPAWSTGKALWAPDVRRVNGKYVLYYSEVAKDGKGRHCVGAASSADAEGPYVADADPIACPIDGGGAIDISGFQDVDGKNYVTYKVDGNNLAPGGSCGNVDGKVPTPLMLLEVDASGTKKVGDPVEILRNGPSDGTLVEAPQIIHVNGVYVLFFSSHCFNTPLYNINYATATSLKGPYTKAEKPLAITDNPFNMTSPGGAQATDDGKNLVFHANCGVNIRCMFYKEIKIEGKTVSFA